MGQIYKDMIRTANLQLRQMKEKSIKKYGNKTVDLKKINRKSHYQKFFEESKRNSKAIWQGIHSIIYSQKSNRINTPFSLLIEGNTITDSQDISEHFNNFFTSIGQDLQKKILLQSESTFQIMYRLPTQINFVFRPQHHIWPYKDSKSSGPDGIRTNILKEIHETILIPLSTLINKSFITVVLPVIPKIAKVIPIFKNEIRLLRINYWTISLLSNIGKIIEKLIHLRCNLFLETRNCYYPFQFSFRLNFSTDNALMSITENIKT